MVSSANAALRAFDRVGEELRRVRQMIEIDSPDAELTAHLVAVRTAFDDAAALVVDRCINEHLRRVFEQRNRRDSDKQVAELMKILRRARS